MAALYWLEEKSLREVGEAFGVTYERVRQLFSEYGVLTRSKAEAGELTRARTDAAIIEAAAEGGSLSEIAERAGCSTHAVKATFKRKGLKPQWPPPAGRQWSHDTIVQAIRDWVVLYGETPSATDWNVSTPWCDVERFRAGDWPHLSTVQYHFGSWNKAIEAAGFEPRKSGHRRLT